MLQIPCAIVLATTLIAGCGSDDAGSDDANDGAGSVQTITCTTSVRPSARC